MAEGARSRQQEILARLQLATEKRAAGRSTVADSHAEDQFPRPALQHKGATKQVPDGAVGEKMALGFGRASWGDILEPESRGQSAEASRRTSIAVLDTEEERKVLILGTFSWGPFDDQKEGSNPDLPEQGNELDGQDIVPANLQESADENTKIAVSKLDSGPGLDLRTSRKSELAKLLQSASRGRYAGNGNANGSEDGGLRHNVRVDRRTSAMELPEDKDTNFSSSEKFLNGTSTANDDASFTPRSSNDLPRGSSPSQVYESSFIESTKEAVDTSRSNNRLYTVAGTGLWKRSVGSGDLGLQQLKAEARESFTRALSEHEYRGVAQTSDVSTSHFDDLNHCAGADVEAKQAIKDVDMLISQGRSILSHSFSNTPTGAGFRNGPMPDSAQGRGELLTPQSSVTPTMFGRFSETFDVNAFSSHLGISPGCSSRGREFSTPLGNGAAANSSSPLVGGWEKQVSGPPSSTLTSPHISVKAPSSHARSSLGSERSHSGSEGVYNPEVFYAADVLGGPDASNAAQGGTEGRVTSLERAILGGVESEPEREATSERGSDRGNGRDDSDLEAGTSDGEDLRKREMDMERSSRNSVRRAVAKRDGRVDKTESEDKVEMGALSASKGRNGTSGTGEESGALRRGKGSRKSGTKEGGGGSQRMDPARSAGKENGAPKGKVWQALMPSVLLA
jgi:hypothetical protein